MLLQKLTFQNTENLVHATDKCINNESDMDVDDKDDDDNDDGGDGSGGDDAGEPGSGYNADEINESYEDSAEHYRDEQRTKNREDWALVPYTGPADSEAQGESECVMDAMPYSIISEIFGDQCEYEEGEILHCYSKEEIAEMFGMSVDDVNLESEPVIFRNQHSDEPSFEDIDEVIIEDMTDEEYPKYTTDTGETLPTFPEMTAEFEAVLKRKVEEKQAATSSKQAESSDKASQTIKDPVIPEFDIEAWFKRPNWNDLPKISEEERKRRFDA